MDNAEFGSERKGNDKINEKQAKFWMRYTFTIFSFSYLMTTYIYYMFLHAAGIQEIISN